MSSPPGGMAIARVERGLDAATRGSGLPCVEADVRAEAPVRLLVGGVG
jgi:hypothetical protein